MGGSIALFYSSIVSFAVSGGLSPINKKFFRLIALAIIIPPICESESVPNYCHYMKTDYSDMIMKYHCWGT
jgi:hypothetical protein